LAVRAWEAGQGIGLVLGEGLRGILPFGDAFAERDGPESCGESSSRSTADASLPAQEVLERPPPLVV
jgi:hypothetical protein